MSALKVDRDRALALHHAGYDTKQIAASFGVKSPAVTRVLATAGVQLRSRGGSRAEQCDRLAELVADGATIARAASTMGIGEDWARRLWKSICKGLGAQAR